jgi:hypothetical protein
MKENELVVQEEKSKRTFFETELVVCEGGKDLVKCTSQLPNSTHFAIKLHIRVGY